MVSFLFGSPVAALFLVTVLTSGQSVSAVKAQEKPPLHFESPYVVTVNRSNWEEVVLKSPHAVFLYFGRRECIHCQNLVPAWEKLAKSVDGLATIAYWDYKDGQRPKIFTKPKGTPALRLITPKEEQSEEGSNYDKVVSEYNGKRTRKDMESYLFKHMPDYSARISLGETHMAVARAHAEQFSLPVALWFTHDNTTSAFIKFLSTEFRRRLLILEIESTENNQGVLEQYGFSNSTELPELLVIPANNSGWSKESAIRYEEDTFTATQLKNFVSQYVVQDPASSTVTETAQVVDTEVVMNVPITDETGKNSLDKVSSSSMEDNIDSKRDLQSIGSPPLVDATCASI